MLNTPWELTSHASGRGKPGGGLPNNSRMDGFVLRRCRYQSVDWDATVLLLPILSFAAALPSFAQTVATFPGVVVLAADFHSATADQGPCGWRRLAPERTPQGFKNSQRIALSGVQFLPDEEAAERAHSLIYEFRIEEPGAYQVFELGMGFLRVSGATRE